MGSSEFFGFTPEETWPDGPVVMDAGRDPSERLVSMAAGLAAGLGLHLVCAFVDSASYLTEWEPETSRAAASLDPATNKEAHFPSAQVLQCLGGILGPPGTEWSFRVLNGDVAPAHGRLADSTGASLLIVGGQRPGVQARIDRILEGSVSAVLTRTQHRRVLIVPDSV